MTNSSHLTGTSFGLKWQEYDLFFFLESLLSLKKSRLLQLLDNQEEGLSTDPPGNLNNEEKDAVSQLCLF